MGNDSKRTRKHLDNGRGAPKCGRQLSRPGATVTNQQSMQITSDLSEVKCRHCLRAIGALPPLHRVDINFDDVPSALELGEEEEEAAE